MPCPHCNRNTFEITAVDVGGTKYNCVQCSGCKAPVSFVERSRVEVSDEAFETRVTEVLRIVVSSGVANAIETRQLQDWLQPQARLFLILSSHVVSCGCAIYRIMPWTASVAMKLPFGV
jgi:hypothetical protein